MTITELGALGEFVGAIAVVATFIFLAIHAGGIVLEQRMQMFAHYC